MHCTKYFLCLLFFHCLRHFLKEIVIFLLCPIFFNRFSKNHNCVIKGLQAIIIVLIFKYCFSHTRCAEYVTDSLNYWLFEKSSHYDTPVPVFLPRDLSRETLLCPSNKLVASLTDLAWYFVCTGQAGTLLTHNIFNMSYRFDTYIIIYTEI